MKIGYARVSTDAQETHLQMDALKRAKCGRVYQEKVSGAKTERPELTKLLDNARKGDVVVVWKLDRSARSLRRLIDTTVLLNERGALASVVARDGHMTPNFETYMALWELIPDGIPITTCSSKLLPVCWRGQPAMLKIAEAEEERIGGLLMVWWAGQGVARVLAHDGDALLMERAQGMVSLVNLAKSGDDDRASRIICDVVARLHSQTSPPSLNSVVPLDRWFCELEPAAAQYGGVLVLALEAARHLLATPQDIVILHGDIHHGNILDFGLRGWLAIDPKGLKGERGFDYANLFCNPDRKTAAAAERLARQINVVAQAADLPRPRLLQWVLAYAGLSAAWTLNTGEKPETALTVAEMAAELLNT